MDYLATLAPGDQIGAYTVIRKVGEGGMGVVYQAYHEERGLPAALKVLSPIFTTDLGRQRFEREVRAQAALSHAHTVEIYDTGETEDGTLYYAMELLAGYDLRKLVKFDGPQAPGRTIRILSQITGVLGEAHALGLVHRDIKPPNIILCQIEETPDVAKLVDFGLVTPLTTSKRRLTVEGQIIGTPRYVAPEMLRSNEPLTGAADFYQLGLVAYYLLSGRHVFEHQSHVDILKAHRDEAPTPLEARVPGCPKDLASVVHWCLEKTPSARPHSARELADALTRCADADRWDEDEARRWWAEWGASPFSQPPPSVPSVPSLTSPERPGAKD